MCRGKIRTRVQRAMRSGEWKTYRTRFLVKAKQLNSSLSFVDPLGRQHSGRKGDYLVESSDGVISITPRRIFEDIYVALVLEREKTDIPVRDDVCNRRKMPQPYPQHGPVLTPNRENRPRGQGGLGRQALI